MLAQASQCIREGHLWVWAEVPWSHSRTTARAVVLALALGLPEAVASDDDPKEVL